VKDGLAKTIRKTIFLFFLGVGLCWSSPFFSVSASESDLLLNPGFESGTQNWKFYTSGKGSFVASTPAYEGSKSAKITIAVKSANDQLYQYNIGPLKANTSYRLSFAAYSTTGHDLSVYLHKHGSPYTNYGLSYKPNLTTSWGLYFIDFTTFGFSGTVSDGRLRFFFSGYATNGDVYWIDRVQLSEITVNNTPPQAYDQSITLKEDTPAAITLLADDADGDSLTYSIVDSPSHGSVFLLGNTVTYTPATDYYGDDSFTFKASDGQVDSNTAAVSLTVNSAESFSLIVLPDTQNYSRYYPEIFTSQTSWITQNRQSEDIAYVMHEGDLVESYGSADQWNNANSSLSLLDDNVSYTLALGNHDFDTSDNRVTTEFNAYFPVARYSGLSNFGGVYETEKYDNSYYFFSASGIDFLVIYLEFGPRNAVLDWANCIVSSYPNHKVILLTHDYLHYDDTLHGSSPSHLYGPDYFGLTDANNGVSIWEQFVKRHANMLFVFSGHVHTPADGARTLVSVGDNGNRVYQMMADYEEFANGGNGYLRIVTIDPTAKTVSVKTYSPYLNQYLTDSENQYVFIDVSELN
jgi:hypothetical protein